MKEVKKTPQGIYRKQEILETALKLFVKKGVSSTTMRALAEEVGIRAASLYNHFESKDDIVDHIVRTGTRSFEMLQRFHDSLEGEPIDKKLKGTIEYWLMQSQENEDIVMIFLREPLLLSKRRQKQFVEATLKVMALFENLIDQGIADGIFQDRSKELIIFNIWALQLSWICREGLLPSDYDIQEYAEKQADLILKQISKS